MNSRSTLLTRTAILAAVFLSGCFSQPKSAVSAATDGSATSSGSGAAAAADPQDWSRTVARPVTDPALNMTAFNVHIPAGWRFTGMIERIPGCHGTLVPADGLAFTALAPDGVTAIERLPGSNWGWATDGTSGLNPKCGPVKISSAAEYLLNIAVPNLVPDAKNIAVVPFTPEMKQQLASINQQAQAQAPHGMKTQVDAARVRLQYSLNGRPVEEILWVSVSCREIDMPAYPMLHRVAVERHTCNTNGLAIRRAPQGKLDPLIGKQLPPPDIDKQWNDLIIQKMQQQFAAFQKQNDDTFRSIQNHFKQVNNQMQVNHQAFMAQQQSSFNNAMAQDRATQASIDHASQMQVRDSLNRQLFVDPNTGQKIETSNQYGHSWINSSGDAVVLNHDPTFDPNGVVDPVRESWTELIPVN